MSTDPGAANFLYAACAYMVYRLGGEVVIPYAAINGMVESAHLNSLHQEDPPALILRIKFDGDDEEGNEFVGSMVISNDGTPPAPNEGKLAWPPDMAGLKPLAQKFQFPPEGSLVDIKFGRDHGSYTRAVVVGYNMDVIEIKFVGDTYSTRFYVTEIEDIRVVKTRQL